MTKIMIIEMVSERRQPKVYFNVKFKFEPPVNLQELAENNKNIEYDPEIYRHAKINTKFGTILLWSTGAQLPRLPEHKEDCLIELKRYLLATINGEKRSFVEWLRDDVKKFQQEIGV